MSTEKEIEQAVIGLEPERLAEFREWFVAFDAEIWDAKIERDSQNGKLDALAEEALADLKDGLCRDL